jgi:heme exporter protein A
VQPLVALRDVGVSRGGVTILRSVDFEVHAGEMVGVAGPNGSGKTTLLRLVATLIRPDHGTGSVLGAPLGSSSVYSIRPKIGLIGHEPALISELSLRENLDHVARLADLDTSRIGPVLAAVGLEAAADRPVRAASRGMQRRVEIALALIRRPSILLLDEAAAGLDRDALGLVDAVVTRVLDDDGAVVTVSHDPSQLTECDRTVNISAGVVAE